MPRPRLSNAVLSRFFRLLLLSTLVLLAGCSKVALFSQLSENEANEMLAILAHRGIAGAKEAGKEDRWVLKVPTEDFGRAVDLLKSQGYPRDRFARMGEIFQKSGLVSSPTEERIRFMYALSQELAETLTHIDGVINARVHIVIPNNDPLATNVTPSSCAVFMRYTQGYDLEALAPQIKQLATRSIEGLNYDNVSLVLIPSSGPAASPAASRPAAEQSAPAPGSTLSPLHLAILGVAVLAAGALGWFLQGAVARRAAKPAAA